MKSKRGQLGEGVTGVVKVFVVAFIALVVLGLSSVFYAHYIDVRDSEARILAKQVVDCFVLEGKLDLEIIPEGTGIFSYCGFPDKGMERFFVRIWIKNSSGNVTRSYVQGDIGALWVKSLYNSGFETGNIEKYEPGYFIGNYPVFVVNKTSQYQGELYVEVIAKDEF